MNEVSLRDTVTQDLEQLVAEQNQMVEQYKQIGRAIEQQSGAIQYARMVLQKIDDHEREKAGASAKKPDQEVKAMPEPKVMANGEVLPI